MPVLPKIYVDFSTRDPKGRLYLARLSRFPQPVALFDRFIGTDFEDFEVECEVLAIDHVRGRVFHRPVDPSEVPGTFQPSDAGTESPSFGSEGSKLVTGTVVLKELDFEPA